MEIPRHWRLKKQRYGLVGEVCPHCDHKMFPPRDLCPNCGAEGQVTLDMLIKSQTEEAAKKVAMFAIEISTPQPVR
ncbi:hypothetical protein KBD75_03490 [Candidatus Woesebacteria bacterium]|nr:hypothetical protein [Candidatus Woesebacteria bacterium]